MQSDTVEVESRWRGEHHVVEELILIADGLRELSICKAALTQAVYHCLKLVFKLAAPGREKRALSNDMQRCVLGWWEKSTVLAVWVWMIATQSSTYDLCAHR